MFYTVASRLALVLLALFVIAIEFTWPAGWVQSLGLSAILAGLAAAVSGLPGEAGNPETLDP